MTLRELKEKLEKHGIKVPFGICPSCKRKIAKHKSYDLDKCIEKWKKKARA